MAVLTADVRDAVRKIVAESDAETMTMRGVRVQLEDALGVVVDKKELKAFVAKLVAGDDAGEEEAKDARIVALTALGRAVKFGPSLFKGLKDMADDDARAAAMKARFEDKGVEFAGAAPTAKEIKTHRARKEREEDLAGIDQSLIIEGKRPRRAAAPSPAPARPGAVEADDDEEAEFF